MMKCYTSVEFIFNDLKLAVKLNNTTTTLQMEMLCYMHHQYMYMYCTSVDDGQYKRHFMQGIRFLVSLHTESQLVQLRWTVFFTNRLHHFCFVSNLTVKMVVSFYVIQTN